ncbi:MAG: hypothetical protein K2X11_14460, partial [Acetobacteraceae bacterium]|nr:hypothetical protein [Acetobacteraceae bacterium]
RPVPPPEARPGEWRGRAAATVLAVATPGDAFRGQPMEIVIRLDRTNRDTAIVQPNEAGLRPGDRVAVTFGERARLTRASGARPAGTISVENEPEG